MLDAILFNQDGMPNLVLHIDTQSHEELMIYVNSIEFPLLSRMRDYYKDSGYETNEFNALEQELLSIRPKISRQAWVYLGEPLINIIIIAKRRQADLKIAAD